MSLKSRRKWILPKKRIGVEGEGVVEYLLKSRKIENISEFLNPTISSIPSSDSLYDSKKAAKKILESIENNEKIVIHGDFDSDGICAVSLLWDFLYRDLSQFLNKKIDVIPYIPSRIDQGYGLTEDSLNDVKELKGDLLISVDCGVRDEELIKKHMKSVKGKKGLKFVITDHHQPPSDLGKKLPYPLVHQMYPNHEYKYQEICGTAVVFLLIQQIKKEVGMDCQITEDSKGLDLVALATVTDMMPLLDLNRVFVKYGLDQITKGERKGMRYLCLRAGLNPKDINSYHLGFVIGPRINAAGRIGSPMEAVKLFVSNDDKLCQEIVEKLESLNFERQKMTEQTKEEAREFVEEKEKAIFAVGDDWHEGVIGLVAGKFLEEYHRPVVIATQNGSTIKGSCRSVEGFNITQTLEHFSKYLERYGGHELAAGFSAKMDTIDEFRTKFIEYANKHISDDQLISKLKIDLLLDTDSINKNLLDELHKLEPLGYDNPRPVISITNLVVFRKTVMGKDENHMKLLVKGSGYDMLTLVMFNVSDDREEIEKDMVIDVVGYPDINVWNGIESIQFIVKEWRFTNSK